MNKVIGLDIENNSIIKAAQLFMATYHTPPCKITVEKNKGDVLKSDE